MTTIQHGPAGSWTTVTPSGIDGLAAGQFSGFGPVFDNSTIRNLLVDIDISLTLATGLTAYAPFGIFMATSVDGVNFETQSPYLNDPLCAVYPPLSTTSIRRIIGRLRVPPLYLKLYAHNTLAVALAGSGNTISIRSASIEHV